MRPGVAAAALVAAGTFAACQYAPDFISGTTECSLELGCPSGFVCQVTDGGDRGVCVLTTDGGPSGLGGGALATGGAGGKGGRGGAAGGHAGAAGSGASGTGGGGAGAGGHAGTGGAGGTGAGGASDAGTCPTVCTLTAHRCAGGLLEACALMNGCPTWSSGMSCGSHGTCTENGAGTDASCVCDAAPAGCNGQIGSYCATDGVTLETCASDTGCLYLQSPPTTCPSGKPCTVAGGQASCSCPAPPAACMGVTGPTCASDGSAAYVTCSRDSTSQCLVAGQTTACLGAQKCTGSPGAAQCTCPSAPPAVCQGFGSGAICSGNAVYDCTTDAGGCVSATLVASCDSGKPCAGTPSAACTCQNPATSSDCPSNTDNGARCSGTTLIKCTTNSDSCTTVSKTTCPTNGACQGTYPSAACVSEEDLGWPTDFGSMTTSQTSYLSAYPISVPTGNNPVLRRFGIIARATTVTSPAVTMVLYASDSTTGNPTGAPVASAVNMPLATGMNEFSATPNGVTLTGGATYWLAVATNGTIPVASNATLAQPFDYQAYTFNAPLPQSWPAMPFHDTTYTPNYYVVVLP